MSEPPYRQGDVVLVSFPYTERAARYRRPTLIISSCEIGDRFPLAWVLMITSAKNQPWPRDVPIDDLAAAGVFDPCVVRAAKIANVELQGARRIGQVSAVVLKRVLDEVHALLGTSHH